MRRYSDPWTNVLNLGPQVQLSPGEYAALERAARILKSVRVLMADEDGTAECSIGSADAALFDLMRDIDPRERIVSMVTR